jgi:alanine racemase
MLEGRRGTRPLDVFFKINTGMNRLGFPVAQVRPMLERLRASGMARSITLMTHFATADGPPGIEEAMARFEEATRGIDLPRSLANSAAIYAHPGRTRTSRAWASRSTARHPSRIAAPNPWACARR